MSKQTTTALPGAETVNGVDYLNTVSGDLRRVDQLPAKDALIHEQVYRMIDFAKGLAAEIARFKAHTFADIDALDAMLAQEYGVTRKGAKGNRSFTSADGRYRVSIKINTPEVVGPELQQAKALIDEIVLEKGADADPVLAALVAQAFDVGKQGRVNTDMLRRLKKMEIDDPRWPRIQKAIGDAITDGVSKAYITFHQWRGGAAGGWQMIPLDMAAVEITDDAFDHPSLRRENAELKAQIALMVERGLADEAEFNAIRAQVTRLSNLPGTEGAASPAEAVKWAVDYVVNDMVGLAAGAVPLATLSEHLLAAEAAINRAMDELEAAEVMDGADQPTMTSTLRNLNNAVTNARAMFNKAAE